MTAARTRILSVALLVSLILGATATTASAVEDETAAGYETVLRGTNDYRVASGLERVVHDPRLSAVAQAWAEKMAADYAAATSDAQREAAFRHNPDMPTQVPSGWQGVGENIAMNGGYPDPYNKLLAQWKASPGHNANMLNTRWTHIGVGTYQDSLGITWGVQVFGDYGTPGSIANPGAAVIDLGRLSFSGTAACVALIQEPGNTEFFRQCGVRQGNTYVFSDVPPGSYSARVFSSGGGVLYDGWPGGALTVHSGDCAPRPLVNGVTRLYGATRYETAIQVSCQYAPGVPAVFVASGTNFPDALTASAAAASLGGPLLLTPPTSLPANVKAEIQRLDPDRIYVAGGTGAVSQAVVTSLSTIAPVTRYGGTDRYATGLLISQGSFTSSTHAVLATGRAFPDALAATGVAGTLGAPVLLVDGTATSVPASTLNELSRLQVNTVVVAGGTGAVSDGIVRQLRAAGYTVQRYGGADRYATAALLNNAYFSPSSTNTILLANGTNFPDGLAGAALAGLMNAPLYTTPAACAPTSIRQSVSGLGISTTIALGGPTIVTSKAATNGAC